MPVTNTTINVVEPGNNKSKTTMTPSSVNNQYMILTQKNAGEILLLKNQYESNNNTITDVKGYMTKLFDNVETLNDQIKAINGK
jgi:hypothetical protein